MDLDSESSHMTDSGSDCSHGPDDPVHVPGDHTVDRWLSDSSEDRPLPPEQIPVIDDDQNNGEWEDEDSDEDSVNDDDLSTESFLLDDSFQVTVSHVCQHWREVALDTAPLWSQIDVETGKHAIQSYRRASTYLSRTKEYPLSISIDVNESQEYLDDASLYSEQSDCLSAETGAQLLAIMHLLLPHTGRWRTFKLTAEDYLRFHTVLSQLCSVGPASLLESLELHNYDEEVESELHSFHHSNHKTPFVLFNNKAPKLRHVSFYGVHIDWHNTTFLKNLHSLELAYLSQDVRPSFDNFFTILRSSLELHTLDLCMAGPFGFPHEWPPFLPPPPQGDDYQDPNVPAAFSTKPPTLDEYLILPKLHELKLSHQSPEELAAFFNRVSMPSLQILELYFVDHEYTDFIQSHLISPPKWQGGPSRESRLTNLKELRITQLPCTPKAIADLYATLVNLETIDFDFNCLDKPFWTVLIPTGVRDVTTPAHLLLPALHTMKVKGSTGIVLRQIIQARVDVELPLKKLIVDYNSSVEKEDDTWLRERVEQLEYFDVSDDDYVDDDESFG